MWHKCIGLSLSAFMVAGMAQAGELAPNLMALANGKVSPIVNVKAVFAKDAASTSASAPGPLVPHIDNTQRVQVYIHSAAANMPLVTSQALSALGAIKILHSDQLQVVQAWIPVNSLKSLVQLPNVGLVTIPTYVRSPQPDKPSSLPMTSVHGKSAVSNPLVRGLAIDQEAVSPMQADQLQKVGAQGAGVKVGVISNDNSGYMDSLVAGYLPPSIWADPANPGTTPSAGGPAEGTAMLEEVHAMAPKAQLGFCGPQTSVEFLNCYKDFIAWGANVITDDLGFPLTDGFSAGTVADFSTAASVAQLTQSNPNVAFTSAAGNDAMDYFQAKYTPYPNSAIVINGISYLSRMDFGMANGGSSNAYLPVTLPAGQTFTPLLQWNDPLGASTDKLALILVDANNNVLATSSVLYTETGRPVQGLSYQAGIANENDYLVIACLSCTNPVTFKLNGLANGSATFGMTTSGSVFEGHSIAPGVLTTVAAKLASASPLSVVMEAFSARGPFLYGDFTNTQILNKPDVTGVDGVTVSGAGGFGRPLSTGGASFYGTSATGPNVAGLIADLMQAYPGQKASVYYSALQKSSNQNALTAYSSNAAGAGLAQGYDALTSLSFHFPASAIAAPAAVANGATGGYKVTLNSPTTFTATPQAGTNAVDASQCLWAVSNGGNSIAQLTGTTVSYTFTNLGNYSIKLNCNDAQGISDPVGATLNITVTTPSSSGAFGLLELTSIGALGLGCFRRRRHTGRPIGD